MVTRLTAMTINSNPGVFIETTERCEYWITRNGVPHALMLSSPLERRADFEAAIEQIKAMSVEQLTGVPLNREL